VRTDVQLRVLAPRASPGKAAVAIIGVRLRIPIAMTGRHQLHRPGTPVDDGFDASCDLRNGKVILTTTLFTKLFTKSARTVGVDGGRG
jgi:hypothetical protein